LKKEEKTEEEKMEAYINILDNHSPNSVLSLLEKLPENEARNQ